MKAKKMMKAAGIGLGSLIVLGLVFQGWVMYSSSVEEQPYKIVKKYEPIEIRYYPPARMISYVNDGNSNRNGSFGKLAGYIFGGNEAKEEFAMTAPVHMEYSDSSSTMSFVLPQEAWEKDMPKPNDDEVQIHWTEEEYVAAIQYSGYQTQESYQKHKKLLVEKLSELNIEHDGNFRTLGYDPPYKTIDRRNEIIVRVKKNEVDKLN